MKDMNKQFKKPVTKPLVTGLRQALLNYYSRVREFLSVKNRQVSKLGEVSICGLRHPIHVEESRPVLV